MVIVAGNSLISSGRNFPADAIMYYSYYLISIHSLDFHVSSPHMTNTYVSRHVWTHTGLEPFKIMWVSAPIRHHQIRENRRRVFLVVSLPGARWHRWARSWRLFISWTFVLQEISVRKSGGRQGGPQSNADLLVSSKTYRAPGNSEHVTCTPAGWTALRHKCFWC